MEEKKYYAHTKTNQDGTPAPQSDWQPLKDHLRNVAALAKKFAEEARPGDVKGEDHKDYYEKYRPTRRRGEKNMPDTGAKSDFGL